MDPMSFVPLVATVLGILVVLIPVTGLTLRFALKPVAETMLKLRESKARDETVDLLERRVALLEEHLNSLDRSVNALQDDSEFRRQLAAPAPAAPEAVRVPGEIVRG